MTPTAARTHVRLARRLAHLPNVAEAFAAGEISREHVAVIARACTPERLGAFDELEPAFLAAAQGSDPDGLRGVVKYACDALDGDGGARSDEDVFKSRRFFVSPTFDGVGMIDGLLDPIGTETLITALDAEMERDRRARTTNGRRPSAAPTRLCACAGWRSIAARSAVRATSSRTSRWSATSRRSPARRPSSYATSAPRRHMSVGCRRRRSSGSRATAPSAA